MVISLGFFYLFFPKYDQWEQRLRAGGSPKKTDIMNGRRRTQHVRPEGVHLDVTRKPNCIVIALQ